MKGALESEVAQRQQIALSGRSSVGITRFYPVPYSFYVTMELLEEMKKARIGPSSWLFSIQKIENNPHMATSKLVCLLAQNKPSSPAAKELHDLTKSVLV